MSRYHTVPNNIWFWLLRNERHYCCDISKLQAEREIRKYGFALSLCLVILYAEAYIIIAHDKSIKQKSLTSPYDICCKSKAHAFWIFASTLLIIQITWISIDKLSPVVILITFIWPGLSPALGAGEDCLVFRCLQILSVWAWALARYWERRTGWGLRTTIQVTLASHPSPLYYLQCHQHHTIWAGQHTTDTMKCRSGGEQNHFCFCWDKTQSIACYIQPALESKHP